MFKNIIAASALAAAATTMFACTADSTSQDDEVAAESDLSAAGQALVGSYKDDTGPFRALVLTRIKVGSANEFIAELDAGERITGTFTAGAKTITLKSTTASPNAQRLLGRYNYLVQGNSTPGSSSGTKFSLWRKNFAQSLEKVPSYCAQASDCDAQGILHPMCVGEFSCTAQNTCRYQCGVRPIDPCRGLDQQQCVANAMCQVELGPRECPPGQFCPTDMVVVFKGCHPRQSGGVCFSSSSCAEGAHCSVEDGVCNPSGMLAVCSGTCVPNANP